MTATAKRFVAFFDIMGFKERVFRNSHKKVLEDTMHVIYDLLEGHRRSNDEFTQGINTVFFSDAILIVSDNDTIKCAKNMLFASSYLLGAALVEKIPIKGAIAYGLQTSDFKKSIHFGRPLIDAFELQNELHMYGAVLHHTMDCFIKNNSESFENEYSLYKYDKTPLKKGKVRHYAINWECNLLPADPPPIEIVSYFYNESSGHVRIYVDNTIQYLKINKPNINDKIAKQKKKNEELEEELARCNSAQVTELTTNTPRPLGTPLDRGEFK